MSDALRVVIVDDDELKRSGMALALEASADFEVVDAIDQDTAARWPRSTWSGIESVVVDILDDRAIGERGTDMYSGIRVVERTRDLPVTCIAVTPTIGHPLVRLRLAHATPDYCYRRWQLMTPESLAEAVRFPDRQQTALAPTGHELRAFGAVHLNANEAVRVYEASELHELIEDGTALDALYGQGVSRRAPRLLRENLGRLGFDYSTTEDARRRSRADKKRQDATGEARLVQARWPVVRDVVLALLGRLDSPATEFDEPWWH